MKDTNFQPRIVKLELYRPGDGDQAWKAMKIAFYSALWLGSFWLLGSFILS